MPVHSAPPLHPTLAGDHFSRSQAELQLAYNIEYLQQLYLAASESARHLEYEVMQFLKSKVRQISREPGTSSTNSREPGDLFTIGTGIMTRAGVLLVIIGVPGGGGEGPYDAIGWFSEKEMLCMLILDTVQQSTVSWMAMAIGTLGSL